MNIIEKAKFLAKESKLIEEKIMKEKNEEQVNLNNKLKSMKDLMMAEVLTLDRIKTKYGKFVLDCSEDICGIIAKLKCHDKGYNDKLVGWFKARVVNTTYDASDECRDIPITYLSVSARLYPPNPDRKDYNGCWDIQELRWYHNGGWTFSASSIDEMPKFLDEIARYLAQWM